MSKKSPHGSSQQGNAAERAFLMCRVIAPMSDALPLVGRAGCVLPPRFTVLARDSAHLIPCARLGERAGSASQGHDGWIMWNSEPYRPIAFDDEGNGHARRNTQAIANNFGYRYLPFAIHLRREYPYVGAPLVE